MITNLEDLRRVLALIFPGSAPPKPLHLVEAVTRVGAGAATLAEAARAAGTTPARLRQLAEAADPAAEVLGSSIGELSSAPDTRVRGILGQLVIGNIAERVFEDFYRSTVGTGELELRDDRGARGDTDYLVLNGSGRQVFRLNIKFHGSQFRRAKELVGLDPEDCFALATYKIHGALVKQNTEHLPYIFVIVGVPGLTGAIVGASIPDELVQLCLITSQSRLVTGKRTIEDQIVDRLVSDPDAFAFRSAVDEYFGLIQQAGWFVLSARRASNLLKENLFERAFALRVPRFALNYRGAELDMHFSLSEDLRPLDEMLLILRDRGMPGLVSHLERGTL